MCRTDIERVDRGGAAKPRESRRWRCYGGGQALTSEALMHCDASLALGPDMDILMA